MRAFFPSYRARIPHEGPLPTPGSGPSYFVKVNYEQQPQPSPAAASPGNASRASLLRPRPHRRPHVLPGGEPVAVPRGGERRRAAGEGRLPAGRRRRTPGTAAQRAGKYVLRGGAIIAWYVPEGAEPHTPFRIVGAHTDSPNLRVKPLPDSGAHGWRQVAVEIYGGPLLNSWLDRDLGLAGRLSLRDGTTRLVNIDRPLLRVPQLAIHLDRSVTSDGLKLDKQRHLQPIWGLGNDVRDGDLDPLPGARRPALARRRGHRLGPDGALRRAARLPGPRPGAGRGPAHGQPAVRARRHGGAARAAAEAADEALAVHPGARGLRPRGERLHSRTPARTVRCSAACWSARCSPAAGRTRTGRGPSPGRSASPPTRATPSTPTTRSGTTRRTTRAPTAAPSSR